MITASENVIPQEQKNVFGVFLKLFVFPQRVMQMEQSLTAHFMDWEIESQKSEKKLTVVNERARLIN